MIDIWMIFMMCYPFLIVSLYTVLEVLKNRKNKIEDNNGNWIEKKERKIQTVYFLLNWGLPIFIGIFIIFYWIVGLLNQYSAELDTVC